MRIVAFLRGFVKAIFQISRAIFSFHWVQTFILPKVASFLKNEYPLRRYLPISISEYKVQLNSISLPVNLRTNLPVFIEGIEG